MGGVLACARLFANGHEAGQMRRCDSIVADYL